MPTAICGDEQAIGCQQLVAQVRLMIRRPTTTSEFLSAARGHRRRAHRADRVFVAVLFVAALFFAPLAGMVPAYASSAALLYVACVMARGLAEMDWDDITETAPAVVAAVTMPLTYSIATGIGLGFITYALIKLIAGRFADAKPAVLVLALIFAVKFALG